MNFDRNNLPREVDGMDRMTRYVTIAYVADAMGLLPNEYKVHLAHLAEHYGSGPSWRETAEANLGVDAALIREFFAECAAARVPLTEAFFVVLGYFGCSGLDPRIDAFFSSLEADDGDDGPGTN